MPELPAPYWLDHEHRPIDGPGAQAIWISPGWYFVAFLNGQPLQPPCPTLEAAHALADWVGEMQDNSAAFVAGVARAGDGHLTDFLQAQIDAWLAS